MPSGVVADDAADMALQAAEFVLCLRLESRGQFQGTGEIVEAFVNAQELIACSF
jgi:hypothetical protein